jgi:hypothetical protein
LYPLLIIFLPLCSSITFDDVASLPIHSTCSSCSGVDGIKPFAMALPTSSTCLSPTAPTMTSIPIRQ